MSTQTAQYAENKQLRQLTHDNDYKDKIISEQKEEIAQYRWFCVFVATAALLLAAYVAMNGGA